MGKTLLKKQLDKHQADKPFKMDFFYYELDVLESVLLTWLAQQPDQTELDCHRVRMVANDLNQKLA